MPKRAWFRKRTRLGAVFMSCLGLVESAVDWCISRCGPLYIATAAVLISSVAFVFFAAIIPEVVGRQGGVHAFCHSLFGVVLLVNIAFNYVMTIRTLPGTSADLPQQVLMDAAEQGRYCARCQLSKPMGSHHCHICDKCILRMDHHCPWMDTCIGFANIRYFLLSLLWLTVGALYAAIMSFRRLGFVLAVKPDGDTFFNETLCLLFVGVLAAAMAVAIGLLLLFNAYLIATQQSTIEFHAAVGNRPAHGNPLVPRKARGFRNAAQNFQDIFDVQGRLWWLTWLAPNPSRKRGIGVP